MKNVSIVIATIARDSLLRAVRSIFNQQFEGNIQICVGIDVDVYGNADQYKTILESECPTNCSILWLNSGYSTSARHGGVHSCYFGGSLRTTLTFLAKYEYVMFLDDDDWLNSDHCSSIAESLNNSGSTWAFPLSIYADSDASIGLCIDEIESVGPNRGIYAERFGGFVRPSGLTFNKLKCLHLIHLLSMSPFSTGDGEDRLFFKTLKELSVVCTNKPTVYYSLDPKDSMHDYRMQYIASRTGAQYHLNKKHQSVRKDA